MGILDSAAQLLGVTEKAILEIADFSGKKPEYTDAAKVSAGAGSLGGLGSFSKDVVKQAMSAAGIAGADQGFEDFGKIHRYRYNVLFNPAELTITGYGGEEVATQDFRKVPEKKPGEGQGAANPQQGAGGGQGQRPKLPPPSSRMAAANTRIDFNVRLIIDRTDNQDAFYADKFTLSQTSIAKGVAKAIKAGVNSKKEKHNTVQEDVEALSAIARDKNKRLARFVWGDMIYEGMINSINAEYAMFNVNGEPCRAYVTIGMVLYDKDDLPSSMNLWQKRYKKSFDPKSNTGGGGLAQNL